MRWIRIAILLLLALFVGALLHYNLPDRQVVRIVDTEIRRVDFSGLNRMFYGPGDSGGGANTENREIWFIQTVDRNGNISVFRNEDTGLFNWPPYLKTRSQDLQTEAADLVSSDSEPRWVIVRHYGWRSNWFTIYPNALSVREIDDPNVTLIPWGNAIIIGVIIALFYGIWRLIDRFISRFITPASDRVAAGIAKTRDKMSDRR